MKLWLRSAAFNVAFFGLTALTSLSAIPLLAFGSEAALWRVTRRWARAVTWLLRVVAGINVRVTGAEHLPAGPGLVAAQHQSAFDTVIWAVLLDRPAIVMKQELLRIPVYGWFCRRLEMIVVDRLAGGGAIRTLLRGADAAVAAGRPVVIFPEGTRSEPGTFLPFQPGVAALAKRIGGSVVPVATDSGLHWGRRAFRKHPGTITVAILPPIPAGQDRALLVPALEAAIAAGYRMLHPDGVDNSVGPGRPQFGDHGSLNL